MKNRINELRKAKQFTLTDLQEISKVPRANISAYERETRSPKIETWQKLSEALGVSAPYLMGFDTHCPLCGKPIDGDK